MNKKRYQQPAVQCAAPWAEMPIAMNVGSQEHEEQWAKERKDDFDTQKPNTSDYGSLW